MAWLLLTALGIPTSHWRLILLPFNGTFIYGGTQCSQIMVIIHTQHFYRLAIQQKAFFKIKF